MGRKADANRINQIGKFVESHPGSKPADVARGLGVQPSSVTRSLPAVKKTGFLHEP